MNYSEFLIKKGFCHIHENTYGIDVAEDISRGLFLVRCDIDNIHYSASILVQLDEPRSHIMATIDVDLGRLPNIDFIVAGLLERALSEYKELLIQEYIKALK